MPISLYHVFQCGHTRFGIFYATFSTFFHTLLVLVSLGVIQRLCYTVFLFALYAICITLLELLVVNTALISVIHVDVDLVNCLLSDVHVFVSLTILSVLSPLGNLVVKFSDFCGT